MARFDRKVERTKKSFEFTQKEKIVETNQDVFKKNFTFKWVQLNIKTVCVFLVDFLLVTLLIIPFMMHLKLVLIKSFLLLEKTSKKNLKKLLVIASKNTFKLNMFSKKLIIFLKGVQYPKVESNLGELDKLFYLVKESLMNHLSLSMLMIIMEKLLLKSFMIF